MKSSHFIRSAIAGLLSVILLAGCAHSSVQSPSPSASASATPISGTSTTQVSTAAPTPTATPAVPELAPIDLKGRVIRVFDKYGMTKQGNAKDVIGNRTAEDREYMARVLRVQKAYNCTVRFVGGLDSAYWEKMYNSCLAGAPIADFGRPGTYFVYGSMIQNGAFMPLNQFKDVLLPENDKLWNVVVNKTILNYDGIQMAICPRVPGSELPNLGFVTFFNKSLLMREGLWSKFNLYDMQAKKTWNWQTLSDISRKVAKDKNGDGELDQVGFNYSEIALRALMHSNVTNTGNGGWVKIENGKAMLALADKQHKPALQLLADFYKKGYITANDTAGGGTTVAAMDMFKKGNAAFMFEYGNRMWELHNSKMADTYGIVAIPLSTMKEGRKDYILPMDGYLSYIICRGVKAPREIAYMIRELVTPEQKSAEEEYVMSETLISEYIGSESRILETFKMLSEPERMTTDLDNEFLGNIGIPMWIFYFNTLCVVNNTVTIEQYISMSMPKTQQVVNDWWAQFQKGAGKVKKQLIKDGKL